MSNLASVQAFAAAISASSEAVAKKAYRRGPPPSAIQSRLRVPATADIHRLFGDGRESPERRVARVSAAAILYALDKKPTRARGLLRGDEQDALDEVEQQREKARTAAREGLREETQLVDRHCLHCRLESRVLYPSSEKAPVVVVRHSAHVLPSFDPDTYISGASIDKYQVLVSEDVARQMIKNAHPLRWRDVARDTFRRSDPVERSGNSWEDWKPKDAGANDEDRDTIVQKWTDQVMKEESKEGYMLEDVRWPWNEDVVSTILNIIKISRLNSVPTGNCLKLSYDYSLESCLQTDLGFMPELGGLDIDRGTCRYSAYPLDSQDALEALEGLTERDVNHLDLHVPAEMASAAQNLFTRNGASAEGEAISGADARAKLLALRVPDSWLVTITANKLLRFTCPGSTPVDLWAALTWMGPALLFSFINQGVSQAAHVAALALNK